MFQTTIVAPLLTPDAVPADGPVNIPIEFDGEPPTLVISIMGAVPSKALGRVRGSLLQLDYEVGRAMDPLFTGF